jgi:signal transduction histidine kinase
VATTAYYVASEALANVVKHAGAGRVEIGLTRRDGQVHLHVGDDGRGGARPRPGSGLAGLIDRVPPRAASWRSVPRGPRGTRVQAVLPCAR